MIRVCIVCEGQTEVEFMKSCLAPYLRQSQVLAFPSLLQSPSGNHRGGRVTVECLTRFISHQYHQTDRITTLVDFYGFQDKGSRTRTQLESDIRTAVAARTTGYDPRFVLPYVQMHEFEGLLFTNPAAFDWAEDGWSEDVKAELMAVAQAFPSPEDINDSPETAPSKRILRIFPEGSYSKTEHGPLIAESIGIDAMRAKCPAFSEWVENCKPGEAQPDMAAKSTKKATGKKRSFHQELVLNRWVLGFFHGGTLAALKMRLGDDRFEGIDEDGQTRFFHELTRGLFDPNKLPEAELRRYDLNIVAHWQAITAHRNKLEGHELQMKYFQYLSLLFTELYLDWYFNRRQDLLDGLNEEMTRYRAETGAEPFRDFEADDLNKIAFWNATGSGKTLLLHVNIRQYLHDILNRIYRTRLKGNSTNCTLLTKCPNIRFPTKRPVKVQVVPSAKSVDSNPILQIAD